MNLEIRYTAKCSVDGCKREFRAVQFAPINSHLTAGDLDTRLAMEITRHGWTQTTRGVWECDRDHTKPDKALIEDIFEKEAA